MACQAGHQGDKKKQARKPDGADEETVAKGIDHRILDDLLGDRPEGL